MQGQIKEQKTPSLLNSEDIKFISGGATTELVREGSAGTGLYEGSAGTGKKRY